MSAFTSSQNSRPPFVQPPAGGNVLHAFGEVVTIHLGGSETDGKFTLWTEVTPPGGGPPPHLHEREDEVFYVLEGRAEFLVDNEWRPAGSGAVAFLPRGSRHTFRNPGPGDLKMLVQTSPAGFEVFFGRCAEEFRRAGGPRMERLLEISAEHGIRFLPEGREAVG